MFYFLFNEINSVDWSWQLNTKMSAKVWEIKLSQHKFNYVPKLLIRHALEYSCFFVNISYEMKYGAGQRNKCMNIVTLCLSCSFLFTCFSLLLFLIVWFIVAGVIIESPTSPFLLFGFFFGGSTYSSENGI